MPTHADDRVSFVLFVVGIVPVGVGTGFDFFVDKNHGALARLGRGLITGLLDELFELVHGHLMSAEEEIVEHDFVQRLLVRFTVGERVTHLESAAALGSNWFLEYSLALATL